MVLIHQKIQTVLGNSAHLPLHSPEAFFHINDFLLDLRCLVPDRPVAGECVDLCEISQCTATRNCDFPAVGRDLSDDDFQKCRLAGPIDSNDGSLLMLFNMKGYVLQDDICPESFCNIVTG